MIIIQPLPKFLLVARKRQPLCPPFSIRPLPTMLSMVAVVVVVNVRIVRSTRDAFLAEPERQGDKEESEAEPDNDEYRRFFRMMTVGAAGACAIR